MPDIAMCTGVDERRLITKEERRICPRRESCYRYTATPSYRRQAYVLFPLAEDGTCSMFWSNAAVGPA